jgi:hypothetical protein
MKNEHKFKRIKIKIIIKNNKNNKVNKGKKCKNTHIITIDYS